MFKGLSLKEQLIGSGIIFLLLLAFISATVAWYKEAHKTPVSKTEYINIPVVKEVAKIKTVTVPGPEKIVTVEIIIVTNILKIREIRFIVVYI